MYEVMACARPILLGIDGEARRLVETEAGAAVHFEPEDATALVSAVLYLREHPEVAELLGLRGRAFVEARFERDHLTKALEERIAMLLEKKEPASVSVTSTPVGAGVEKS
jgi:glycosyltransferase involved in cell wall biosynthesis